MVIIMKFKRFTGLSILLVASVLLFGCEVQQQNTQLTSSEKEVSISDDAVESNPQTENTWADDRIPEIEVIDSVDGWNTWKIEAPTREKNTSTCFSIQVALPSEWEAELIQDTYPTAGYAQYRYIFFDKDDDTREVKVFSVWPTYNHQDNPMWASYSDKLAAIEFSLPPSNAGGDGKYHIDNSISITYEETNGKRWLLYCGYYAGYVVEPQYEGMNFCNAYTVYDDTYEILIDIDLRNQTLEDPDTRDFVLSILETVEIELSNC